VDWSLHRGFGDVQALCQLALGSCEDPGPAASAGARSAVPLQETDGITSRSVEPSCRGDFLEGVLKEVQEKLLPGVRGCPSISSLFFLKSGGHGVDGGF